MSTPATDLSSSAERCEASDAGTIGELAGLRACRARPLLHVLGRYVVVNTRTLGVNTTSEIVESRTDRTASFQG
jgi:hypothetical protein